MIKKRGLVLGIVSIFFLLLLVMVIGALFNFLKNKKWKNSEIREMMKKESLLDQSWLDKNHQDTTKQDDKELFGEIKAKKFSGENGGCLSKINLLSADFFKKDCLDHDTILEVLEPTNNRSTKSLSDFDDLVRQYDNFTDIIHVFLIHLLKKDKRLKNNQEKIDFIDKVGDLLLDGNLDTNNKLIEGIEKLIDENKGKLEDENGNSNLKYGLLYLIGLQRFKNDEKRFSNADRTIEREKEIERKYKSKQFGGYLSVTFYSRTNNVMVKKILKPGLNGKKFSQSKYINLWHEKPVKRLVGDFKTSAQNELYISQIIEVLFPEYFYKIRKTDVKLHKLASDESVLFKINESAMNIKKEEVNSFDFSKINKQSVFDTIALFLLFGLSDRNICNFMIIGSGDNQGLMNIDYECVKDLNKITCDVDKSYRIDFNIHFKNFVSMLKDFNKNKDKIIELLVMYINITGDSKYEYDEKSGDEWTKKEISVFVPSKICDPEKQELMKKFYKKFFDTVSQEEIKIFLKDFLSRFNKENVEKVNKILEVYKDNPICSQNIEFISEQRANIVRCI